MSVSLCEIPRGKPCVGSSFAWPQAKRGGGSCSRSASRARSTRTRTWLWRVRRRRRAVTRPPVAPLARKTTRCSSAPRRAASPPSSALASAPRLADLTHVETEWWRRLCGHKTIETILCWKATTECPPRRRDVATHETVAKYRAIAGKNSLSRDALFGTLDARRRTVRRGSRRSRLQAPRLARLGARHRCARLRRARAPDARRHRTGPSPALERHTSRTLFVSLTLSLSLSRVGLFSLSDPTREREKEIWRALQAVPPPAVLKPCACRGCLRVRDCGACGACRRPRAQPSSLASDALEYRRSLSRVFRSLSDTWHYDGLVCVCV